MPAHAPPPGHRPLKIFYVVFSIMLIVLIIMIIALTRA